MTQRVAQVLGWLAVSVIIGLSLVPGAERPHTGASGHSEHIVAYLITAALLGFGYRSRRSAILIVIGLCALSGVMEICQIFVIGRHPGFDDFLASASGAVFGVALTLTSRLRTVSVSG